MLDAGYRLSFSRREFLRGAVGAYAHSSFRGLPALAAPLHSAQKVVVVTFGGGARDEETFRPTGQENIPHLLHDLMPQSTFFTQVVNNGILGHYVATASLATGTYEKIQQFRCGVTREPNRL